MDVFLKRENIDLPADILQKLSMMALEHGKSLKAYIESVLISQANSYMLNDSNPSPSNDGWFLDSGNLESVRRGISEMENGNVKPISINEIQELLGV